MKETLRLAVLSGPALAEQGNPIAFISGDTFEAVTREQEATAPEISN
ncbi:hypothetical protein [Martelella soudanensis]|nr:MULTISPECIES: hypothetical protein [unclassified Martelella]